MKKISLIILASLFLTACSGLRTEPPHNLDNACSIKKERKSWYRSMVRAERRWGVPVPVMMASIYQESKGAVTMLFLVISSIIPYLSIIFVLYVKVKIFMAIKSKGKLKK